MSILGVGRYAREHQHQPVDDTYLALVLARVSGVFMFVPLPGISAAPGIARVVLSLSMTMALFSTLSPSASISAQFLGRISLVR